MLRTLVVILRSIRKRALWMSTRLSLKELSSRDSFHKTETRGFSFERLMSLCAGRVFFLVLLLSWLKGDYTCETAGSPFQLRCPVFLAWISEKDFSIRGIQNGLGVDHVIWMMSDIRVGCGWYPEGWMTICDIIVSGISLAPTCRRMTFIVMECHAN